MSKENAKRFIQFVLKECGEFSQEDMEAAVKEMHGESELTDEELNAVSGGIVKGNDGIIIKNDGIPIKDSGMLHSDGKIL